MKKREHPDSAGGAVGDGRPKGKSPAAAAAAAAGEDEDVDELLAALGYKVRASDMADVAQKLQQLETAMNSDDDGSTAAGSHLVEEAVHYNPSDLSAWLENMLLEVNAPLSPPPPPPPASKRMRSSPSSSSSSSQTPPSVPAPAPVVVLDAQEAGIRLVHALMACAEAVSAGNLAVADDLVKQISVLAASQLGAMRKVAAYFGEALARRLYRFRPAPDSALIDSALSDMLHLHFYESSPYLKFAHFTANQAILEAFAGCRRVHVVDFGVKQGMQWPALLQALALRHGGPPAFRLTGIGPSDAVHEVGYRLAEFASTINVDFTYQGLVASSLADVEPLVLTDSDEAVAVNSMFELHRLLAHPGAVERVLATVLAVRPRIVTVVEQEANHNAGSFLDRFTEALHYYCTMFDSLEGTTAGGETSPTDTAMSEVFLGRQICNIVACDGEDRTERHESLSQWRARLGHAGFEPVHLGSNAYKQASTLLALFAGGDGYRVEEKDGCLTLGWHTRPLIATSAWRPVAA